MKEIRFSDHAKFKIDILANHELNISPEFIIATICNPDKIEILPESKVIAWLVYRTGEGMDGSSRCIPVWDSSMDWQAKHRCSSPY